MEKAKKILDENIEKAKKKLNENKDALQGFGIFALIIFIMVLIAGCGNSNSDIQDKAREQGASDRANCKARSDTYTKCSYSSWEGRCVCKQR